MKKLQYSRLASKLTGLLTGLLAVLLVACGQEPAAQAPSPNTQSSPDAQGQTNVIGKLEGGLSSVIVGGEAIPDALVKAYMKRGGLNETDPTQLKQAQAHLAQAVALAQRAVKEGALSRPDVELERLELLSNVAVVYGLNALPAIDDASLLARYDREREKIGGLEYQAQHLLFANGATAEEAAQALNSGTSFADLRARYQGKPFIKRNEVFEWIHLGRIPDEHAALREAMRALKPGQFSKSAIITPAGWHLVQVDDIRPFELPPFDQLKEQVRQSEMAARRQQLIDETRAAAKISGLE